METKNTLETIYIDLRNCDIWEKKQIEICTRHELVENKSYPFLMFYRGKWDQGANSHVKHKTELTYPEFIKLFEGGETRSENSEVERIRRSAIENLVLMKIDKKMEHLNEIEVARIEGVLTGLKICKELWAQGTISHEVIQEEIYHYQEELDNLNSKK